MTDEPRSFDAEAVIDAMAPLIGLVIDPAFRPGIATNLTVTASFAAILLAGDRHDEAEPAPVFVA